MATAASPQPTAPTQTPDPTLTPIQEQVVVMLAAGIPTRLIADEAHIHRNTIGNWRRSNPVFAQALADAQYERVLYWRDQAEEHAALAIDTIGEILSNPKTPASVRLRAALAILQQATTLPPSEPAELLAPQADLPDVITATHSPETPSAVHSEKPHNLHNPAQPTSPASPQSKSKHPKALSLKQKAHSENGRQR